MNTLTKVSVALRHFKNMSKDEPHTKTFPKEKTFVK